MTEQQRYEPRRTPLPARPAPPPRKHPPKPRWVYMVRRWVAALLLLFLVVGFIRACVPSEHDREMKAWQEQAQYQEPPAGIEGDVPPSQPLEMVIPSVGLRASFEDGTCRFVDGAIDPESLSDACVFTAPDKPYSLPGTSAQDIVVIAGHAAAGVPAVFDKLYDAGASRHTISPGDELFVRTEASGSSWLRFQATDLHEPDKTGLSSSDAIWGTGPMPGRLLTITCIQPANPFQESVRNAVIGWQLQEVVSGDQVPEV